MIPRMEFLNFGLKQKLDQHSHAKFHGDSDCDWQKAQNRKLTPNWPSLTLMTPTNGIFQLWTRTKVRPTFLCRISFSWRFRLRWFQSPKTDNWITNWPQLTLLMIPKMEYFNFGLKQKCDHYSCVEFHGESDSDCFNFPKPQLNPQNALLMPPKVKF